MLEDFVIMTSYLSNSQMPLIFKKLYLGINVIKINVIKINIINLNVILHIISYNYIDVITKMERISRENKIS